MGLRNLFRKKDKEETKTMEKTEEQVEKPVVPVKSADADDQTKEGQPPKASDTAEPVSDPAKPQESKTVNAEPAHEKANDAETPTEEVPGWAGTLLVTLLEILNLVKQNVAMEKQEQEGQSPLATPIGLSVADPHQNAGTPVRKPYLDQYRG